MVERQYITPQPCNIQSSQTSKSQHKQPYAVIESEYIYSGGICLFSFPSVIKQPDNGSLLKFINPNMHQMKYSRCQQHSPKNKIDWIGDSSDWYATSHPTVGLHCILSY